MLAFKDTILTIGHYFQTVQKLDEQNLRESEKYMREVLLVIKPENLHYPQQEA